MSKSRLSFQKRQKELARQRKKEEKKKRAAEKQHQSGGASEASADDLEGLGIVIPGAADAEAGEEGAEEKEE